MAEKVCPVVIREEAGVIEVLAFEHPTAGKQLVKGGIKAGETASEAAIRELEEESGIRADCKVVDVGGAPIGPAHWHFFAFYPPGLPERWKHLTHDDFGHTFSFFWQPLADELGDDWHGQFHEAFEVIRRSSARWAPGSPAGAGTSAMGRLWLVGWWTRRVSRQSLAPLADSRTKSAEGCTCAASSS